MQTEVLVDGDVLVERKGRRVGVGEDLELRDRDLDLTGLQVRVDVLRIASVDHAGRRDHVLGAQPMGHRVGLGRAVGVQDELDDPGALSHVDEDQSAVVAPAVHPAGDPDLAARPLGAELSRPHVAILIGLRGAVHAGRPPQARERLGCEERFTPAGLHEHGSAPVQERGSRQPASKSTGAIWVQQRGSRQPAPAQDRGYHRRQRELLLNA